MCRTEFRPNDIDAVKIEGIERVASPRVPALLCPDDTGFFSEGLNLDAKLGVLRSDLQHGVVPKVAVVIT